MERGALSWAEGLGGVLRDGLKTLYASFSGHLDLPAKTIQVPPGALRFLQGILHNEDDDMLLQVCSARSQSHN